MKSVTTLPKLNGARVLVRVDYNIPFKKTKTKTTIADARRIDASFATIKTILKKGGTPVLIAHLGDETASLRPIASYLSKTFPIVFVTHDINDDKIFDILDQVPKGTVILLENIRRYNDEEKNVTAFAKRLAKLGSFYVNDAFSVSHRAHASIVGIPKYLPSYAGHQLSVEITALSKAMRQTKHPFVLILGGAKFGTKIPLLKRFVESADKVILGGAILNNFYLVAGFEIGASVVEQGFTAPIKKMLKSEKLYLPIDLIVVRKHKNIVCTPLEVTAGDTIVDIGPESVKLIAKEIQTAKLVVWNGPMGWYEKGFTSGTQGVARAIAQSTAHAIIGGGDTGAVVEKMMHKKTGTAKQVFISTGGGAALDYLSTGSLPGIAALDGGL